MPRRVSGGSRNERWALVPDPGFGTTSSPPHGTAVSPIESRRRRAVTRAAAGAEAVAAGQQPSDGQSSDQRRVGWSRARLAAAVSMTRCVRGAGVSNQLLVDELDFIAATGSRGEVRAGTALVHRGSRMPEVHLVERGAVAVLGDHGGRRPILDFALRRELCCAVPVLLHQNAPWDAVAVTDGVVVTMPADVFTSAVRERWVDRWTTRALTWLAEVGARVGDVDESDPAAQVAELLLRARGEFAVEPCRRTIADLLDLDDSSVREILGRLEMLEAIDLSGGRVAIVRTDILRAVSADTSYMQPRG